jgi:hypothetical protein
MLQTVEMLSTIITDLQTIAVETCSKVLSRPSVTSAERVRPSADGAILFFVNATTCPLWTPWSPLPVVADV